MAEKNNQKSPYNPESSLFRSLTDCFPDRYSKETHKQVESRKHLDMYANRFRSRQVSSSKSRNITQWQRYSQHDLKQKQIKRYVDFDEMEYVPEIASSLDIYADEMTTYTQIRLR